MSVIQIDPNGIVELSRGSLRKQRTPGKFLSEWGIPKGC